MRALARHLRVALAFCVAPAAVALGCQAGNQDATGGAAATSAASFANGTTGVGGMASCAKYQHTEVHKPVNLYVMFDKSSSMAGSKWDDAKKGLSAYVENPGTDSVRAALRFFPRDADATPACDQTAYRDPTVDYVDLPAGASKLEDAMAAEMPNGFDTPIYPALGGAILEGLQVAANNPDQASAVLLVTDGAPDGPAAMCNGVDPTDPAAIADLAKTGLGKGVSTYVVGLPGVNQDVANQIAAAGGTTSAILVSVTNVATEFQKALETISGSAVPCDYAIPDEVLSGEIGLNNVNVELTPMGADAMTVDFDPTCAGDGWKYDKDPGATEIILCPATCAAAKQDGASIQVVLGCGTVLK